MSSNTNISEFFTLIFYCSPLGEIFRARLRQFPALVNCCTIDWFSEWPAEALRSVAMTFLTDIPELDADDKVMEGLVCHCFNVCHYSKYKIEGNTGFKSVEEKILRNKVSK